MPFGTIILNDGNRIPAIAFGTGSALKGQDVSSYVEQALNFGFSHIDTAQYYQTEESAGKGIRESGLDRSEVYVTTKYSHGGGGDIQQVVRQSLSNLGLTYLDLYLVHFPDAVKSIESGWKEFEKIKKDGLARSIGVSNFNLEQLQSLIKTAQIKPAVNQVGDLFETSACN
ncbi:hypothetical protein AX14_013704 [Amanita brunnescens Koide BX004]|nr:hypothetical protein AX14_013704 [Amanita brunnescens Koide BX004]